MTDINTTLFQFLILRHYKAFVLLCLIFCMHSRVIAQDMDSINATIYSPLQLKNLGKNAILQGDYAAASVYLEQYLKYRPNKYKVAYQLAESYRINRDYENAQKWYKLSFDKSNGQKSLAMYYYALMLKMNGDCNKSKESFLKFKKLSSGKKNLTYYTKQLKLEIAGCDSLTKPDSGLVKINVMHLDTSINKVHVEHAPIMIDSSTVIYASLRTDKELYRYLNPDSLNNNVRKFYKATRSDSGWVFAGELEGPFNDPLINTTNGSFSVDGNRFYFTRCEPDWKNKTICSIFVSEKQDDDSWGKPKKLDENINEPRYTSTQPAAAIESAKGNEIVYFVSDRPKGRGGFDIWYFIYDLNKKTYSVPKNAGNKINSASDEVTPYYHMETHSLYFSSNGWAGMGGLDIVKSRGELKKFAPIDNVGSPINSTYDDIYYSEGKNGEEGFFVSNRKGGITTGKNATCCDDIYSFKRLEYVKIVAEGVVSSAKGEEEIKTPLKNATVSVYMIDSRVPEPVFIKKVTTNESGKYFVSLEPGYNYKFVTEREGHFNTTSKVDVKNITSSQTIRNDIALAEQPSYAIVIKNIQYEFDKAELTPQSKTIIDTTLLILLQENPTLKIELSSHTDSKGSDEYNLRLSQRRAESVTVYLTGMGIDKKRLVAKGYGETKPIALNQNSDGSDNPEGRAKNRRTEFKVIGKIANTTISNEDD